jgi:hypothetical protein
MFAVGGFGAPKSLRQVRNGRECRRSGIDPARQPRCDFLEQPTIAVWVAERCEGAIAGVVRRGSVDATSRPFGSELSARRRRVEHLADLGAAGDEVVARSGYVGNDKVEILDGARPCGCDVRAELDRACRTRRRELDDAEAVIEGEVGVESPTEISVELLRALDIRYRDHDDLELQINPRLFAGNFLSGRGCLLSCVRITVAKCSIALRPWSRCSYCDSQHQGA